jgi:ankyrin repeat protein
MLLTDKTSRFLLASLHVDSLVSKKTTARLKSALDSLSHGSGALGDAYDKVIDRIDGQVHDDCTLAKDVLSWISYAQRPLTTGELCHALAVEIGDENFDPENIPDVEDVLSVCAGLVTVDEESQIIRLVHYTTQEYLEGIRESWHPRAQQEIASTCLTYLCFEPFKSGPCVDNDEFESTRKEYRFLGYSAMYWPVHVAAVQEEICDLAMVLLQDSNLVTFTRHHSRGKYREIIRCQVTGLHLTSSFGLLHLSKELLSWAKNEGMNLADSKDSIGDTPLLHGVRCKRKNVVELLLGTGEVDVNAKDRYGRPALVGAVIGGHKDIVQLLLCTGKVDVSEKDSYGRTALTHAISNGHKEIVELLLGIGEFDVDAKIHGWTPIFLAVREGHKEIVELLLGLGEVNVDKIPDRSALLSYAVEKGYEDLVEFLLGISTDASKATDRWPLLALIAASRHREIAELLGSEEIELNANVFSDYRTLLMRAVFQNRAGLVELLLKAGADINAKTNGGDTALVIAAKFCRTGITELLLNAGAEVNAKDKEGSTALMMAASNRSKETVKLLLDRGADVHAKDNVGATALMQAATYGRRHIVALLLRRGADIHAKDDDGLTALVDVANGGNKKTVKLLLERGADVHAKDIDGSTALIIAARSGRKRMVKLLLRADADVYATDEKGSTALMAALDGYQYVVKMLLDRNADVHIKTDYGEIPTAVLIAERRMYTDIADLLRAHMSRL